MSEVWQSRASGQTKGQVSTPATVRAIVSHRGPRYCKYATSVYRPRSILAVSCIAIASASPTPRHGRTRRGLGGGGPGDVEPHLDHRLAGALVWLEASAEAVVKEQRRPVRGVADRPHPVEAVAHEGGVGEPPEEELGETRHRAPVEERQVQPADRGHILAPGRVDLAEPVTDGRLPALSTHRVDHSATGSPWRTGLWDVLLGLLAWRTTIHAYFLVNGQIWKTILSITFKRFTRTLKPARSLNGTARSVNRLKNVASTSWK